jgi:hypothetical protein
VKGKFPGSSGPPRSLRYHGWKETFGKPLERLMRSFIHPSDTNIVKKLPQSPREQEIFSSEFPQNPQIYKGNLQ